MVLNDHNRPAPSVTAPAQPLLRIEPQAEGAVALHGIAHCYPTRREHTTLDLDRLVIEPGEKVALIGPSGAGKTTLLHLLDGRLRGWTGEARVLGQRLSATRKPPRNWRAEVGFIFQEFELIERASVRENVQNGRLGRTAALRSLAGHFTAEDKAAVDRALADVGMADLAQYRVNQLSGGQRQRVAIARCLAQEPKLLLADEPVSNLDPVHARAVLDLLARCAEARGTTMVISSHQPQLVAGYVDRFVALDKGRMVFDGRTEDLHATDLSAIYGSSVSYLV